MMQNWKRVVMAGAAATAAVLFLNGKRPASLLAAGVGLAVLASEYPEKFEQVRKEIPHCVDSANRFLEVISRAGLRIAELAEDRGEMWEELRSY